MDIYPAQVWNIQKSGNWWKVWFPVI